MYAYDNNEELVEYIEEALGSNTEENKLNILCVDNNGNLLKNMDQITELRKETSSISILRSGGISSIVKYMKENKVDLLILDLEFPELTSIEAGNYIRKTLKKEVPIVHTSSDLKNLKPHMHEINWSKTTFLKFPFRGEDLSLAVKRIVDGNAA
ncbi:MAG: two-component SAPR family response regulator [Bacteriovoracaceae bacterium]|jgi:two-component SAPR family response regulator